MPIDWDQFISKEAIEFTLEIPKKLHFTGISQATIDAKKQGQMDPVSMPCLILDVDRENDQLVQKKWYIASKKAVMIMRPYIVDTTYLKREFTVTKHGKAPAAWYGIDVGPIK